MRAAVTRMLKALNVPPPTYIAPPPSTLVLVAVALPAVKRDVLKHEVRRVAESWQCGVV